MTWQYSATLPCPEARLSLDQRAAWGREQEELERQGRSRRSRSRGGRSRSRGSGDIWG